MSSQKTAHPQEVKEKQKNSVKRCNICRKNKKKCHFSNNESERCDYCKQNNLECSEKTFAREARKDITFQTLVKFLEVQNNSEGLSQLHIAAILGNLEILQAAHKVNPEAINGKDKDGRTPLWHARDKGNLDAVRCLELAGAKTDVIIKASDDQKNDHPNVPGKQALTTLPERPKVSPKETGSTTGSPTSKKSSKSSRSSSTRSYSEFFNLDFDFDFDEYYANRPPIFTTTEDKMIDHLTFTLEDEGTGDHVKTKKRTNSTRSRSERSRRSSRRGKRSKGGS
ncbi:uncharacterized protein GGS22DRAFT_199506 [Annulohypoxylon maeteangense]|uniref:uncharacterized protein n=1 Tax=Annulohypoxylon maeteangense TaxID=1927788 RepID=UPI002007CF03|nr:uncharacterized protein GGS22DRAFT_199506 [Annulohypoxylon maeteangense]KAI0886199.1 hypothetical protein GGS22DRAFT_199506 [Annulohypoxylon maeteangense]